MWWRTCFGKFCDSQHSYICPRKKRNWQCCSQLCVQMQLLKLQDLSSNHVMAGQHGYQTKHFKLVAFLVLVCLAAGLVRRATLSPSPHSNWPTHRELAQPNLNSEDPPLVSIAYTADGRQSERPWVFHPLTRSSSHLDPTRPWQVASTSPRRASILAGGAGQTRPLANSLGLRHTSRSARRDRNGRCSPLAHHARDEGHRICHIALTNRCRYQICHSGC